MRDWQKAAILSAVIVGASALFLPQGSAAAQQVAVPVGRTAKTENPAAFEGFVWRLDNDGKEALPRKFRTSAAALRAPNKKFHLAAA